MSEWIPIIVAALAALPGLLALRSNDRKLAAEAKAIETEVYERALKASHGESEKMQARIDRYGVEIEKMQARMDESDQERAALRARVKALENELEEYKFGVGLLIGQLVSARMEPTWRPRGVDPRPLEGLTR